MNLGPYKLNQIYTGDARELAESIPDSSVDLIFTDPIYQNIDDYRWLAETAARVLKPDRALLTFIGVNCLESVICAMRGPLPFRGELTWNLKGPSNKRYGKTIDNGAWILWYGGWPEKYTPLVWDSLTEGDSNNLLFKWQKSQTLTVRHISDFTRPGSIIVDFFCGRGAVPAACKILHRNYLAFEIDPATADRARERVLLTQPPLFVIQPEQLELV